MKNQLLLIQKKLTDMSNNKFVTVYEFVNGEQVKHTITTQEALKQALAEIESKL